MNKNFLFSFLACAAFFLTAGCGNKTEGNPEADSLRSELSVKSSEMDQMNLFLDAVNVSMDSVVNMEGDILRTTNESPKSVKQQIQEKIDAYKLMLDRQKERIAKLEATLKDKEAGSAKMLKTIASLKQQIDEKNQTIINLTEEINRRDFDIENLRNDVINLHTQMDELEASNKVKDEAIEQQTDKMNEAYVFIGSMKELKDAGLASGGFMKKAKLNVSNFDKSKFKRIDIRNTKSFKIPAKDAEVMSQMPVGSYTFSSNGDGTCTLMITDVTKFWSVSTYLVVKY